MKCNVWVQESGFFPGEGFDIWWEVYGTYTKEQLPHVLGAIGHRYLYLEWL